MHNIPLSHSLSTVHLGASEGGNVARREPMFLSFPREHAVPFVHQQPSCLTHEENASALCGKIKGGRGPRSQHNLYMAWKLHAWLAHLHYWHSYKNQLTIGAPLWTVYSNHCLIRAWFFRQSQVLTAHTALSPHHHHIQLFVGGHRAAHRVIITWTTQLCCIHDV